MKFLGKIKRMFILKITKGEAFALSQENIYFWKNYDEPERAIQKCSDKRQKKFAKFSRITSLVKSFLNNFPNKGLLGIFLGHFIDNFRKSFSLDTHKGVTSKVSLWVLINK